MRLTDLDRDNLTDDQTAVLDAIESGPRGNPQGNTQGNQSGGKAKAGVGLLGPYGVWVRAPAVGHAVQALGAAVRFESKLPEAVKEVAICTVGAFHHAKFEFAAHKRLALAAGVAPEPIDQLRRGEAPEFDGAEALAHAVAHELLNDHVISPPTYQTAVAMFGEPGVIELVTVIGYYVLVSYTLNAFEVPILKTMEDPFP